MFTTGPGRPFTELSDRTVLLALEEITHTLNGRFPSPVTAASQAQDVLDALFEATDTPPLAVAGSAIAARRILAAFAHEEESANLAGEILADPPKDDQMGGEDLATDLVVLAGVVAFLRLHIGFHFKRSNGRSTVEFRLEQKPLTDGLMASLVRTVLDFFQREQ
ncbi:hypothetical protein AB0I49_08375 [Streptomyces sp. NPDC050617]|uniref:hypothetical protein n=1 Tax=Streptomyces sp. NPDC050617 TaxID=3154628 RepID=UPI00343BB098